RGIVATLENLGIAELVEGRLDRADELLRESLEHSESIGSQFGTFNALVGLGAVAAAQGAGARAARLLGAAQALREQAGAGTLEVLEARLHDDALRRIADGLDEEELRAAWAEGRGLALEEAVREALRA